MSPNDLYPLVSYPNAYLGAAVAFLLIALWLWWFTRPVKRPRARGHTARGQQRTTTVAIAELRQQYEAGEISLRELHLRASKLAREFGQNMTGFDCTTKTAQQLRQQIDLLPVAQVVEQAEEPSFEADPHAQALAIFAALEAMVEQMGEPSSQEPPKREGKL